MGGRLRYSHARIFYLSARRPIVLSGSRTDLRSVTREKSVFAYCIGTKITVVYYSVDHWVYFWISAFCVDTDRKIELLMKANILFFGATADITGNRRVDMELPPGSKASEVFEQLVAAHPLLAKHRLHFSVNQQYSNGDEILIDGDELAIFTAVSGG